MASASPEGVIFRTPGRAANRAELPTKEYTCQDLGYIAEAF
jgi:hypothetical protein